jgi:hypothetical protein
VKKPPAATLTALMHCPAAHEPVHARPQPPQFALSVMTFTHAPLHIVCPVGHAHAPLVHDAPAPQGLHCVPPEPQLATPSLASPSHVVAVLQQPLHPLVVSHAQTPATQCVPEAAVQAFPHPPQLALSV